MVTDFLAFARGADSDIPLFTLGVFGFALPAHVLLLGRPVYFRGDPNDPYSATELQISQIAIVSKVATPGGLRLELKHWVETA